MRKKMRVLPALLALAMLPGMAACDKTVALNATAKAEPEDHPEIKNAM